MHPHDLRVHTQTMATPTARTPTANESPWMLVQDDSDDSDSDSDAADTDSPGVKANTLRIYKGEGKVVTQCAKADLPPGCSHVTVATYTPKMHNKA